jgi:hypothetical protein
MNINHFDHLFANRIFIFSQKNFKNLFHGYQERILKIKTRNKMVRIDFVAG